MKKGIFIIWVFSLIAISCQKDENIGQLPAADQLAFEQMEDAYLNATTYNDSLRYCHTDTTFECTFNYLMYCDSLYHHYENMWIHSHEEYDHENGHCDHGHNSMGMHHNNDYHHQNENETHGHQEMHHDRMEDLMHDHEQYHP